VRPTRASKRTHIDSRSQACILAGSCRCGWGCAPFNIPWEGSTSQACIAAGVCQCGWGCDPIQPMPTLNDVLQLRTMWNASCLCWWGAARAVGWRWPADDRQPAASWCSSFSAWGTGRLAADAGLLSWSVLSGTPPDGDRPSLGSAVPFVVASQRRKSRPPRQAQLTKSAECWTRRRRHGADGGAGVDGCEVTSRMRGHV
jgi:hypothetical protein